MKYILKLIDDIESVQRRGTVLIPEIKNLSFPERLQKLGQPTLAYRRANLTSETELWFWLILSRAPKGA